MKRLLPIIFPLTSCIAFNISMEPSVTDTGVVGDVDTDDTNDTQDTDDTEDTVDEPEELDLDTSSDERYGLAVTRGWHLLLDGQHGLVREFPDPNPSDDMQPLEEEFTNILSWYEGWGFSASLGALNEEVHDYLVNGTELPLFQTQGRLLTLNFGTHNSPDCASGQAVYPMLTLYQVENGELCEEISIDFINNAKSFCKNLTEAEFETLGDAQHPYREYLEGGFEVTVFKLGNQLRLWLNQSEVAIGEVYPSPDSTCNIELESHSRELYFGKGMTLPNGRTIHNLVSRVDNIVLLTPEVQIEDMPGVFNIWEDLFAQPYEVFEDVDVASGANQDGFGWWPFENPSNSRHVLDHGMSIEPQSAVDFSPKRGGAETNGPNNLMRIINLDNDDEFVEIDNLYVNEYNDYGYEADW